MKRLPMAAQVPNTPMSGEEGQTAYGLMHCNNQLNKLTQQVLDAAAQVGAVVNLLHARGLIDDAELAKQRAAETERLVALYQERDLGVKVDASHPDKYAIPADALPDIDCASRYHICHALCCTLRFALTVQDLDEGVVRWEYGQPYMIRHGDDSTCVHKDRETHRCTIYARRPGICRAYDCRQDERIWADFEQGILSSVAEAKLAAIRHRLEGSAASASSEPGGATATSAAHNMAP